MTTTAKKMTSAAARTIATEDASPNECSRVHRDPAPFVSLATGATLTPRIVSCDPRILVNADAIAVSFGVDFLGKNILMTFASSVISSVIALPKAENGSERTKADERIGRC
jgi:hypothetical protein